MEKHVGIDWKKSPIVITFVVIALLQGIYYLQYFGPLTIPDPDLHVAGTYSVATGQSFSKVDRYTDAFGNERKGQELSGDSRYLKLVGAHNGLISDFIAGQMPQDSYREAQLEGLAAIQETVNQTPLESGFKNRGNNYFPLAWAVPGLGMHVGMIVGGGNPLTAFQWARSFNLLCFLLVMGSAIALLPRMRFFLVVLGILPTTIFSASSLMPDAMLTALCALATALVLRALERGELSKRSLAMLTVITCVITLVKAVYVPLCLGYLVYPHAMLSRRDKLMSAGIVALAVILYLVWKTTFGDTYTIVNLSANQSFALGNLASILARMLYSLLNLPAVLSAQQPIYPLIACCLVGLVVWHEALSTRVSATDWRAAVSSYRYVVGGMLAALVVVCGIYVFLLLTWNDLPAQSFVSPIEGFQGRYLIPVYVVALYLQTLDVDFVAVRSEAYLLEGKEKADEKGCTR